eukprot:TRINITY_DN821_c0_g1_i1.p1 TRINITY_DN821_c0_g1~~TRINITY_DN821_c0_g1_i1.p1  ORF type:complete len:118 (+),score=39.70 TRINITY_DN821_c0_g1_i1:30-383(+)
MNSVLVQAKGLPTSAPHGNALLLNFSRWRSTKGSGRVRNAKIEFKKQLEKNKIDKKERQRTHQEKMIKQKKDSVERRLEKERKHLLLLEKHQQDKLNKLATQQQQEQPQQPPQEAEL